jgi:hypothetical protein
LEKSTDKKYETKWKGFLDRVFGGLKDPIKKITADLEASDIYKRSFELKKAFEAFISFNDNTDLFKSAEICQIMDFIMLMKEDYENNQFHAGSQDT